MTTMMTMMMTMNLIVFHPQYFDAGAVVGGGAFVVVVVVVPRPFVSSQSPVGGRSSTRRGQGLGGRRNPPVEVFVRYLFVR